MVIFASLLIMILVSASRTTYKLSAQHTLAPQARGGYALAVAQQRPVTLAPKDEHANAATETAPERACERPPQPAWPPDWNIPHAPDGADGNASD